MLGAADLLLVPLAFACPVFRGGSKRPPTSGWSYGGSIERSSEVFRLCQKEEPRGHFERGADCQMATQPLVGTEQRSIWPMNHERLQRIRDKIVRERNDEARGHASRSCSEDMSCM